MVEIIPLDATARQEFQKILGGQNFTLRVVCHGGRTYMDALIDGDYVMRGQICRDRTSVKQFRTRKMDGDFYFVDMQGKDDPYFTGFGTRFFLTWASEGQALNIDLQLPGYLL